MEMSMNFHEIEAEIRYLTTEEGGRRNGVFNGYRGQFYYDGDDHDGGQFFPNQSEGEMVELGITVNALVRFPQSRWDEVHSKRITVGMEFEIHEGAKMVGHGIVKRL
tara:strand:- start:9651 stop:9971 length:321 start_codon:yes stop_codon:yes gene_type:complete